MHKKCLKLVVESAMLNFTYVYHGAKIAKAGPGFENWIYQKVSITKKLSPKLIF